MSKIKTIIVTISILIPASFMGRVAFNLYMGSSSLRNACVETIWDIQDVPHDVHKSVADFIADCAM